MEKQFQVPQGDVCFTKISKLPEKFKGKKVKDFTFAEGESAGARHRVVCDRPESSVEIMDAGNGLFYMRIKGQATITHPEHKPDVVVEQGIYFVTRQREFDVVADRLVRD